MLLTILRREYVTRVRRRSFVLLTILTPVVLLLVLALPALLNLDSGQAMPTVPIEVAAQPLGVSEVAEVRDAALGMLGVLGALLMYALVLSGGTTLLAAVIEEKQNRMAEVLASCVEPRQLLLGKVLAVALLSLTQLTVWSLVLAVGGVVVGCTDGALPSLANSPEVEALLADLVGSVTVLDVLAAAMLFAAFFVLGYLVYASLFVLCGARMDGQGEGGQLQTLVMAPQFAGVFLAMHAVLHPDSVVAVVSALFPLTSPMVMLSRLPFGVPAWQVVVAVLLLVATFALLMRVAERWYREGLLPNGRK